MSSPASPPSKRARPRPGALASALAVSLVAASVAGVARSAQRAADAAPAVVPALAVRTATTRKEGGYPIRREFLGVVEARRESHVGFELPGELELVAADEGELVEAGALLARLNTDVLEAERATKLAEADEARARLELAAARRARVREAYELDAVSQQAWDDADKGHDAARAAVARAEAGVSAIETRMRRATLVAPFAALVAHRYVDEGQVIGAGTPVLHLLENVEPEVRIGVAGDSIDELSAGDEFELDVRGRRERATVRAILPVRGNGTRTVDVVLSLHAHFDGIRRGDVATLALERHEPVAGSWLPLSALTEGSRGLWSVYVAEPLDGGAAGDGATHRIRRRDVEVLHQEADRVFVRGTLSEGDAVVLEGLHRLVPDLRVRLAGPEAFTTLTGDAGRP